MKNFPLLLIVMLLAVIDTSAQAKSRAVLKFDGTTAVIEVRLINDDAPRGQPSITLFSTDKKFEREVSITPPNLVAPFTNFDLAVSGYNPNDALLYAVVLQFDFNDQNGNVFKRRLTLPVEPVVNVELARDSVACPKDNNLQMIISTANSQNFSWEPIQNWLDGYLTSKKSLANLTVKRKGEANEIYKVISFINSGVVGRDLGICLILNKNLPPESFDAVIDFVGTPPPDVALSVSAKKLDGTFIMGFPKDAEAGSPDRKTLENTLEFGASFTSSVEEEQVPATETTAKATVRRRKSKGVFDIGFEYPLLKTEIQANKWMTFLNPFFKATVSTGKIEKDTLSRNRVLFGLQGEFRYRQRRTNPDDRSFIGTHRILWGLTHASDRDFKQKEIYATVLYSPIWSVINNPYVLNYETTATGEKVQKLFGYTVEPAVGFDFGRTYSRRNPASAIEISPVIRRLHIGLNLGLDITSFVSLTAEDTLYIRWEDSEKRMKNFFKATGNFKLFRSNKNRLAHGLFVTYEKGQSPPFATPETNSVRIGYRVTGNFCGLYCR